MVNHLGLWRAGNINPVDPTTMVQQSVNEHIHPENTCTSTWGFMDFLYYFLNIGKWFVFPAQTPSCLSAGDRTKDHWWLELQTNLTDRMNVQVSPMVLQHPMETLWSLNSQTYDMGLERQFIEIWTPVWFLDSCFKPMFYSGEKWLCEGCLPWMHMEPDPVHSAAPQWTGARNIPWNVFSMRRDSILLGNFKPWVNTIAIAFKQSIFTCQ